MTSSVLPSTEDLEQIVTDVFESFLGEEIPQLGPKPELDSPFQASVSITGGWEGHVVLGCTPVMARSAAGALLQIPVGELAEDDVADAIGELANMIGGNIKGLLPGPSSLTLPVVSTGTGGLRHPSSEEALALNLSWQGEPFVVSVLTGSRNGQGDSSS